MSRRIVDLAQWTPYNTVGKAPEFSERILSENEEFNLLWKNSETVFNGSFIFYANNDELKRWENLLFLDHKSIQLSNYPTIQLSPHLTYRLIYSIRA